ncbi:hypothetical protein [Pantoea agglomerans]|uniref:hypothetical protein n=1 Tax=Enterobacter agglomerans TaxID=549 RepID=UPI001FD70224|nr:hypothetical protein [Pantoea agglomerans]UOV19281.1 hypothetical protein LZ609_04690 [Pantoea agglomerans]
MPKYKVLKKSFINGHLLNLGDEIEFEGKAGSNLELIGGGGNQPGPEGGNGGNGEGNENLAELQEQYEQLFQKKAHPAMKADTLREKIAEKRKEIGQ